MLRLSSTVGRSDPGAKLRNYTKFRKNRIVWILVLLWTEFLAKNKRELGIKKLAYFLRTKKYLGV